MSKHWGSEKQPYYHPGPNFTVDIIVCHKGQVLLIQRKGHPHKGSWALPGGFHDTAALPGEPWLPGKESAREAAVRELQEETGIDPRIVEGLLQEVAIFDRFGRDPRDNDQAWAVSQVFALFLPDEIELKTKAGSDAKALRWASTEQLLDLSLAFDHGEMLRRALPSD